MSSINRLFVGAMLAASMTVSATPHPSVPNGSFLRPYKNLWNVTLLTKSVHRHAGTWSDDGRFVMYQGRRAFRRLQVFTIKRNGRTTTTLNVLDALTMRPLERVVSTSSGSKTTVNVAGPRVTSVDLSPGQRPQYHSADLAGAFYDFSGGLYGLLLVGYPLSVGYHAQLPTLAESDLSIQRIPFKVVTRELVEAKPGTKVLAWKVVAIWHEPNPRTDGSILTFWLTTHPPYIIKLIYDSPKIGRAFVYTMA